MMPLRFELRLPEWLEKSIAKAERSYPTIEDRMRFVIGLSRLNVKHEAGGPFAAAVFKAGSGELYSAGVNLVIPANCSVCHAEIVALMLAQQKAGTFDLGGEGMPAFELVSSSEPCAMCIGAIPWSGVRRLVVGARGDDAIAIGFDEGHKPERWVEGLTSRGIEVKQDVLRDEAASVLREYLAAGGVIYNARRGN